VTDEELRRKAAVAIRLALNASGTGPGFDELRDCVAELDEDGQNRLYSASENLGDAILDIQGREHS
jgi:hypothetical protein